VGEQLKGKLGTRLSGAREVRRPLLKHDGITPETFTRDSVVYQIGVAPVRIDILTHISGVQFSDAWPRRVASNVFGVPVDFIGLDDLIVNKRAAGRGTDIEHLDRIQDNRK